jgi:arylsulfatase A-like enzyme
MKRMRLDDDKTLTEGGGRGGLLLGLMSAFVWGLLDGVGTLVELTASSSLAEMMALLLLSGLSVVALVLLLLLGLMLSLRFCPSPQRLSRSVGALMGLGFAITIDAGMAWFAAAAPHTQVSVWRGNPLVFGAGAAAFLGVCFVLGHLTRSRPRAAGLIASFMLCGGAVHQVQLGPLQALGEPPPQGAPNVLLITIDTIRADMGSSLASGPVQTPNMDRLAAQGVRFIDAVSQIPITGPSHLTMMSGRGPWEHGVLLNGVALPPDTPLLAERFLARGYRTGAFVSAFVLKGSTGFARGFQIYDDAFGALPGWDTTMGGRFVAGLGRRIDPHQVLERRSDKTVDAALSWLGESRERPFFGWVHLFDPHGPYAPPAPWDTAYYTGDPRAEKHDSMDSVTGVAAYMHASLAGIRDVAWVRAQYGGEISFTDVQLGRLLDWLDTAGLAEDTVVVLAGDHGESLGEGGVWFNHGGDLNDAQVRVPFIVRYPAKLPAGVRVRGPVELTDLAPTLAALTPIEFASVSGVSQMSSFKNSRSTRSLSRGLCFDRAANMRERRAGNITAPTYTVASLRSDSARYELRTAPNAAAKVWDHADPEDGRVVDPLLYEDWPHDAFAELMKASLSGGEGRDEATLEKLRALGYVQ